MKRYALTLLLLFACYLIASEYQPVYGEPYDNKIREDETEFKQKREQWIEDMHRIEPGANWRVIENETRLSKYEKIQSEHRVKNGQDKTLVTNVTIGRGGLEGYWTEKGSMNQAGRIHTAYMPTGSSTVYAASAGGNVWRGNIDGENWTCLNNNFRINDLRFITTVTEKIKLFKRVIAAGYNPPNVYYTGNDGETWTKATGLDSLSYGGWIIRAVARNTTNEILLLCGIQSYPNDYAALYHSTNNGTSFSKIMTISTDPRFCDIWTPRYDNEDVYIIYEDNITKLVNNQLQLVYKINTKFKLSVNFGKMSQTLLQGTYYQNKAYLAMLFRDATKDTSYLYSYNETDGFKYKGIVPFRTFDRNSFSVSVNDPNYIYAGNLECYRSKDGGINWTKLSNWYDYYYKPNTRLHADIPGIVSFRRGTEEVVLTGTDGGLFKSEDKMGSVSNISRTGLNVSQYYSTVTYEGNPGMVFAGSQDQGFQMCRDDSSAILGFVQETSGDYGHLTSGNNCYDVWGVYPGFVILYDKANQSGTRKYTTEFKNFMENSLWMPPMAKDPSSANRAYLLGGQQLNEQIRSSYLWRLTPGSDSIDYERMPFNFVTHNDGDKLSAFAGKIVYTFPKKGQYNYYYALTQNGRFFYSTDRGTNWTENTNFRGPGAHYFYGSSIVISGTDAEKLYVAGSGYSNPGVWVSTDHGLTFNPLDSGLPRTMVYKIAGTTDDEFLFAATEAGPYIYIKDENCWYSMSSADSPDQTFWSVEYLPESKRARFSTYGRGIWDFKIVSYKKFQDVSYDNYEMPKIEMKAYPNPFGEKVSVDLICSKTANYNIRVFDLSGKLVRELYSGRLAEGKNQFEWDGRSTDGRVMPGGTYMMTASSEGYTNFVKLILNR